MKLLRQIVKLDAKLALSLLAVCAALGLVGSLLSTSSGKTFTMPNQSMVPTIEKGESVEANMDAYKVDDPSVGDLAMFIPNENKDLIWIFRVAAAPGDVLSYRNGTLVRNDTPIHAPEPLAERTYTSPEHMKEGYAIKYPYTLKPEEYFFLSDDPSHMHDSRYWGIIERKQILGKLTSHK